MLACVHGKAGETFQGVQQVSLNVSDRYTGPLLKVLEAFRNEWANN